MNIVAAVLVYFVLIFGTVFSWFVLGQYVVDIFVIFATVATTADSQAVVQNCVTATNFTFIAMCIVWTIWFVYAAHSDEYEQTYYTRRY